MQPGAPSRSPCADARVIHHRRPRLIKDGKEGRYSCPAADPRGRMHAAPASRQRIRLSRRQLLPILNHALASVLLVVAAGYWLGRPVWHASKSLMLVVGLFVAAYFVSAVVLAWTRPHSGRAGLLRVVLSGLAAFGIAYISVGVVDWHWPHAFHAGLSLQLLLLLAAIGMAMLIVLHWASEALDRRFDYALPVVLLAVVGAAWLALGKRPTPAPTQETSYLDSSLYVLKKTAYRNWIRDGSWRGGAIAA